MSEKWFDDLPDNAFMNEAGIVYREALATVKEGLSRGLSFDTACEAIKAADENIRKGVIDDVLKVLIAEEYFGRNTLLEELGKKLQVSQERLEKAKLEMLEDVENSAIGAYHKKTSSGNA